MTELGGATYARGRRRGGTRDGWRTSRVLYGGRVSLPVAAVVVVLASIFGTLYGALAGYLGGWLRDAIDPRLRLR